MNELTIKNNI